MFQSETFQVRPGSSLYGEHQVDPLTQVIYNTVLQTQFCHACLPHFTLYIGWTNEH